MYKRAKGVTLMELIVAIVVLGVAIAPLLVMVSDVVTKHAQAEIYYRAIVIGRDLMEEVLAKSFDDIVSETKEPVPGYPSTISVNYVDPDSSPTGCTNGIQTYALDCYKSSATDYKRIDITVHNDLIGDLHFSSVVSRSH